MQRFIYVQNSNVCKIFEGTVALAVCLALGACGKADRAITLPLGETVEREFAEGQTSGSSGASGLSAAEEAAAGQTSGSSGASGLSAAEKAAAGQASAGQASGGSGASGSSADGQALGEKPDDTTKIYVYVCGAVREPQVAELPVGSRAQAALEAAGGFAEDAARDAVNLAEVLSDGSKLYFPTLEEKDVWTMETSPENPGLVNINTAGKELLCTLPGIGEARAEAIIAYREQQGGFRQPEDIMQVSGIKEGAYQKIKELITVR